MITLREFENLDDARKNCLFYLRGIRDRLASSIVVDFPRDGEELVERMIGVEFESAAFHKLFDGYGENLAGREKVLLFRAICLRIGRIERERCGAYLPAYLQTA